jgi:hypothetical protein
MAIIDGDLCHTDPACKKSSEYDRRHMFSADSILNNQANKTLSDNISSRTDDRRGHGRGDAQQART